MPKVLFFSDLHLHNWSAYARTDESGLNSRLVDQLTVLAQIAQTCRDQEVDALVFCGDLFHSRTKIDVDVLWCAQTAFRQLAESVPEFYILVGNHDQSARDGSIHSLDGFRSFANVIDTPRKLSLCNGELTAYFHPFTTDYEAFMAYCKTVPKCDLFVAHQGVSEALVGAFEISLKADIPLDALPSDRASLVMLGHYHKHQWLQGKMPNLENVAYVGSPLQLDFGERNEEKGFVLVDFDPRCTDDDMVKFIPSVAPRFRLYDTPEEFQRDVKGGKVDPTRDFVRVHGEPRKIKKLQEAYPQIQTVAAAQQESEAPRIDANLAASDRDLLTAYITRVADGLDQTRLLDLGLNLLEDS